MSVTGREQKGAACVRSGGAALPPSSFQHAHARAHRGCPAAFAPPTLCARRCVARGRLRLPVAPAPELAPVFALAPDRSCKGLPPPQHPPSPPHSLARPRARAARGARRVPAGEQGREGARRRKRFFAAGAGARAGSTAIGVAAACTWRHRAPIPRRAAVAAPRASSIYTDLETLISWENLISRSRPLITAPFTTGMHPLQDAEGQEEKL